MVEETGNWTPQELAAVLRKWEHVGPRLCGRAADMIEAQAALLQECCSSFEAQNARVREALGAKVREIGKGRDDNDWRPDPATVEYIASYLEARQ